MTVIDWSAGRGTVRAGGKSLEWATFGPATVRGPVVVLLHEGLGCIALWRDFPARIAQATGLPVFAYSRAGYGQSEPAALPRPLDYMSREALEVLPEVLEAIGQEEVILLGHSDGATIAALYAGSTADPRVRGLILIAPHFFTEPMGLAEIAKARDVFATGALAGRMAKYHRDAEATFRGWNDAWLDPGFAAWNVAAALEGLRTPALVIQGRQDQYGTLAQVRAVEARSPMPVHVEILETCRHSPHLDQPDRTLAAIADYALRLTRTKTAEAQAR